MPRPGLALLLAGCLAAAGAAGAAAQDPTTAPVAAAGSSATLQQFANLNRTFHVDVPLGWRQIAPNEALRVAEQALAPRDLRRAEPRVQYAVGPVDQWLAGTFQGPWLYVTELGEEAVLPEDFAVQLAAMWREHGLATGVVHALTDVQPQEIGPGHHPVMLARRLTTPADGQRPTRSLDAYVATGRQQITFAFTCWADEFDRWEPSFQQWLQTATFARPARPKQKLTDRLWSPILTGALVGLVLLALYKHTHRRR